MAYRVAVMLIVASVLLRQGGMLAAPQPVEQHDHYTVNARFNPTVRQITGSLVLEWTNTTGQPQDELPFRLYPNAAAYVHGGTELSAVSVDGVTATFSLANDPTVAWVPLAGPASAGDTVEIALSFVTTVPTGTSMAVDVLHGSAESGWWLADWLPILGGWEPGYGWYLEPPGALGNPTFATSATWTLALSVPSDLTVIGTGTTSDGGPNASGERTVRIDTPPVRDLTLVLLPASDLVVTEHMVGDVRVRLVLPSALASRALVDLLMDTAADVLPFYRETLGALPGGEIDLVPVDLAGFGGIAWSGTIWIDFDQLTGRLDDASRDSVRFVLAHELVHQWVPAVIGSNNNRHNYLSESLASHLALLAWGTMRDETQASEYLATDIAAPYLAMLDARGDGVVDDPVASTRATADRVALVYGKGVLGFEAIRQKIGPEAYLQALNAYAEDFRFGVSRPTDLQAAFEEAAGQDLSVPWHTWFSSATTTATDVAEVVEGFATPPGSVPQDRRFPRAMAPRVPVPGCQNGANGDNLSQIVRAFRTGDSP